MKNHNSEVSQEIRQTAKGQLGSNPLPEIVSNQIVPVIEVNPKIVKNAETISQNELANNLTATIMASSLYPTRDIYITGAQISAMCDVNATNTAIRLTCTINGSTKYLLTLSKLTTTAFNGAVSITFPHPIKIDRNSSVFLTSDTNVAAFRASAIISFFVDESSNA